MGSFTFKWYVDMSQFPPKPTRQQQHQRLVDVTVVPPPATDRPTDIAAGPSRRLAETPDHSLTLRCYF